MHIEVTSFVPSPVPGIFVDGKVSTRTWFQEELAGY